MSLLDNYLKKNTAAALLKDNKKIIKVWNKYLGTIEEKGKLISKLSKDNSDAKKLRKLLNTDLVDISGEEVLEDEMIKNLSKLEHQEAVKRVHRLERCLGYLETRYEYLHNLMVQVYYLLNEEMNCLDSLPEKLDKLKELYKLELEIVGKINNFGKVQRVETFNEVFINLVRREKIIEGMNDREKKLYKKVIKGMERLYATDEEKQKNDGITLEWIIEVEKAIQEKIDEGIDNEIFLGYHPDIGYEFVNKPQFVDLVREKLKVIRKGKLSEEMINIFVLMFRE